MSNIICPHCDSIEYKHTGGKYFCLLCDEEFSYDDVVDAWERETGQVHPSRKSDSLRKKPLREA